VIGSYKPTEFILNFGYVIHLFLPSKVVSMIKRNDQSVEDTGDGLPDDLEESLEVLIERDNPMANAAERALEIL